MEHKNNQTFVSAKRLHKAAEFKRVFKLGRRISGDGFRLFYCKNQQKMARLGLAVPKKFVRAAVVRNKIKRLIRESFRLNQLDLCGYDIVVVATSGANKLEKPCLRNQLNILWQRATRYCSG